MGIYEFMALSIDEQADAVWSGTFLASRSDKDGSIQLWELGGFYIEVFYSATDNTIKKFRPFKTTKLLDPYLAGFDLKSF